MTQAIQLTETNVKTLLSGDQSRIEQLVTRSLAVFLTDLSPQELSTKAWHWVRDTLTGQELVLWIPHISETGHVYTLDPANPGITPEILASRAELIDRDPLDMTHQSVMEVIEDEA